MKIVYCPECSSDEISITHFGYYCNDCCYEFDDYETVTEDGYEKSESDLVYKFYEKSERNILKSLSLDSLFSVFNPQYQFIKMNDISSGEDGDMERYTDELCKSYIDKKSFEVASKIKAINLSDLEREQIFNRITTLFLASINDLKFIPNSIEWSDYIGAPIDYIESLLKDYEPNILISLPQVDCGDASLILSSKLEKLTPIINSSLELRGKVNFEEVLQNFDYFFDRNLEYANWEITDFLQERLSKEINVLNNYERESQTFIKDGLQKFYIEGNDKGLAVGEVVRNILNHYFYELFEKQ